MTMFSLTTIQILVTILYQHYQQMEVKSTADSEMKADVAHLRRFNIHGGTVAHVVAKPGWRWSTHVKPMVKTDSCQEAHTGYLIRGRMGVVFPDKTVEVAPGSAFYIPAGHDAYVVGDEDVEMIDFKPSQH